jgi:hypothetical protein
MNERIYTLAEQVGAIRWNDELNGNSIDFSPAQFEKFAELIVQECIDYCGENLSKTVGAALKIHFGVE